MSCAANRLVGNQQGMQASRCAGERRVSQGTTDVMGIKLWKAICAYKTMLIEEPFGGAHEEMIPAWKLGRKLGIPDDRIKHFCRKWVRKGRWMIYGSMCGSFNGYEKPNVSS